MSHGHTKHFDQSVEYILLILAKGFDKCYKITKLCSSVRYTEIHNEVKCWDLQEEIEMMTTRTRSGKTKSKKLRRDDCTRVCDNILAYLEPPKVIVAENWDLIILELATSTTVMYGVRVSGQHALELAQEATVQLIARGKLIRHEDEDGAIMALPYKWPPEQLQVFEMTLEDLDPGFDWRSLANTQYRRRKAVVGELFSH